MDAPYLTHHLGIRFIRKEKNKSGFFESHTPTHSIRSSRTLLRCKSELDMQRLEEKQRLSEERDKERDKEQQEHDKERGHRDQEYVKEKYKIINKLESGDEGSDAFSSSLCQEIVTTHGLVEQHFRSYEDSKKWLDS